MRSGQWVEKCAIMTERQYSLKNKLKRVFIEQGRQQIRHNTYTQQHYAFKFSL